MTVRGATVVAGLRRTAVALARNLRRHPFAWTLLALLLVVIYTRIYLPMHKLPRNQSLAAFQPHRADFVCKHDADVVPLIDPEADAWFYEALSLTRGDLWPEDRDYVQAAKLYAKAIERKHWKAFVNLATLYLYGDGVDRDTERAVLLIEDAMRLGIPMAFLAMGDLHFEGRGVKQDATRAYAFWQLAADMGSAHAQAYLGEQLFSVEDRPKERRWANRKVAFKMLECSFAQGHGPAAAELGGRYAVDGRREDALRIYHEGVKFGSERSATSLYLAFKKNLTLAPFIDPERARRYDVFALALELNPDLRFPNLDKVLPLPPAELPVWRGTDKAMIDATKAVHPRPRWRTTAPPRRAGCDTPSRTAMTSRRATGSNRATSPTASAWAARPVGRASGRCAGGPAPPRRSAARSSCTAPTVRPRASPRARLCRT